MTAALSSIGRVIVNSYAQDSRSRAHLGIDITIFTINTIALFALFYRNPNDNFQKALINTVKFNAIIFPFTAGPDFCYGFSGADRKWLTILRGYATICGIAATYGITQAYLSEED